MLRPLSPLVAAQQQGAAARRQSQPLHATAESAAEQPGIKAGAKRGRKPSGAASSRSKGKPDDVSEKGMRELPKAAGYQQTLLQSFTLGGIGLHTGEYATVRVRPAMAGEGRYFVRVAPGTNEHLFRVEQPMELAEDDLATTIEASPEVEKLKVELFTRFLAAQERDGYEGTFDEWVFRLTDAELSPEAKKKLAGEYTAQADALAALELNMHDMTPEDIEPRREGEGTSATLENVFVVGMPYTQLGQDDGAIKSVEHLLSALEACGIDNARIEIEGGCEVPVLDGSALGWTLHIQNAGARPAPPLDANKTMMQRLAMMPKSPIVVQEGESWAAFYPGFFTKLSYGIDHQDVAPIIGQQWYTWRADQDYHYRYELAAARSYAESVDELVHLRDNGFLKAGAEFAYVIGYGDRWWDPKNVRFFDDEPVRHKLVDLIGDLALLGSGGHAGLPLGHVVAYKADHALHVELARAIYESLGENDWVVCDGLFEAQAELMEEMADKYKRPVRRAGVDDSEAAANEE